MQRVYELIGLLVICSLSLSVVVGIPSFVAQYFAWDFLAAIFETKQAFWSAIAGFCVVATLPVIALTGLSSLPDETQEDIKIAGIVFGEVVSWIGKGVLIAVGIALVFTYWN